MGDTDKIFEQLNRELSEAKKRISDLEDAAATSGKTSSLYYGIFENFVESATDSFSMWDSKLNLIYINNATLKYHPAGTRKSDVIGKNIKELIPNAEKSGRYEKYKHVLETGEPLNIEDFKADPKYGDTYLSIKAFKVGDGIGIVSSDVTERKRLEKAVQDNQQRLTALIDNAPDTIFSYNGDSRFTSVNRRGEELLGYSKADVIGKTFGELTLFTPESLAKAQQRVENYKQGHLSEATPYELIAKDGSHVFVEVRGVPIVQDEKVEIIAIARDITERRKMEEALTRSEEKLHAIFEAIGDSVTVIDVNGNIKDLNSAAVKLFGCKNKDEALGMNSLMFIAEDDQTSASDKLHEGKAERFVQYKFKRMDGSTFWGETSSDVIYDSNGNISGFVGIVRDITGRRKMEEALTRSEQKLRAIFESIGDGVSIISMEGKVTEVNETALRKSGYSREEFLSKNGLELIAEKDRDRAREEMYKALETGYTPPTEFAMLRKDGSEYPGEATSTILRDPSGNPAGLVSVLRDISERKRLQEDLRESEEKIRQVFNSVGVGITVTDMEGKVTEINDFSLRIHGYSKEELMGQNGIKLIAEKDRPRIIETMIQAFKTGHSSLQEFTSLKKDGAEYDVEAIVTVMSDTSGKPTGLIISVTDITERKSIEKELKDYKYNLEGMIEKRTRELSEAYTELKQNEAALKESEGKYRSLVEQLTIGIVIMQDNRIVFANSAMTRINGYNIEEMLNMTPAQVVGIAHTDTRERLSRRIDERMQGKDIPEHSEWRITRRDGSERWLESFAVRIVFNGKPAIQATLMDITERKRMESALRNSEEKLRTMFTSMADGVIVTDLEGNFRDANMAALNMFGYHSKEDVRDANGFEFIANSDREMAMKDMAQLFDEGIVTGRSWRFKHSSGKEFQSELSTALLRDDGGYPTEILVVMRDITERKRMEEALRESEEKLRATFEAIADGIAVANFNGKLIDMNTADIKLFGYESKEQLTNRDVLNFVTEADRARVINDITSVIASGQGVAGEYRLIDRNGKEFDAEVRGSVLRNSRGEPTAIVNVIRDITERKRMEVALRESEEWHRALVETSGRAGVGIAIIQSTEGRIAGLVYVNDVTCQLAGYSREELLKMSAQDLIPPDALEQILLYYKGRQRGGNIPHSYETVFLTKKKVRVPVMVSVALMEYKGKPATVAYYRDISERKRIEDALGESEQKLRTMFSSMADGVVVVGLDGKIKDLNEAMVNLFEHDSKEAALKENAFSNFITKQERDSAMKDMASLLNDRIPEERIFRFRSRRGREFTAEVHTSLLFDASGNPTDIICVVRDVTERKRIEEALRQSEEKLRAIYDSIGDGITVTDLKGKVIDLNAACIRLAGFGSKKDAIGINGLSFIAQADRDRARNDMFNVLQKGIGITTEYKLVSKSGKEFDAEVSGAIITDSEGKPAAIVNVIRDITDRKQIEEALRESEAKYRSLVEQSEQGICILQDGKIVFANNALSKMSGYTLKEMYTMSPGKMVKAINPKFRTTYAKRLKGRLQGDKMSPRHEYRIVQKDGMERDIETYTKRIMYKGAPAVQAAIVDITERKEWEEKLNKSKEELRFYLNQITQAQEEERKRIARELHDDTIQELIALSRQIDDMVDKKITPEEDRRDSREKLEMARQRVAAILQSVRAFTRDLRPSILDDLGLIPALEWLTSDMSGRFGIPVNISILGSEKIIPPDAALAMFRIAQESLSNAGRHSNASQVQVNLKYTSKNVTLSVIDDGVGFTPPKQMSSLTKRGKLGIAGMYERAQLVGAALSIKSKRGSGTTVVLELPI